MTTQRPLTRTYSIKTITQILDRSRRWVYKKMETGELEYEYIAGARRVHDAELRRFMAANGNEDE